MSHTRAGCDGVYSRLVEAIGLMTDVDAEPCWRALEHALYDVARLARIHADHVLLDLARPDRPQS